MIGVTVRRAAFLGAVALATASCSGDPVAPSTGQSLFQPQFSGTFAGTAMLTSVTAVADGECVQPALQAQVGTAAAADRVNLAVTEDAKALSARLSSATTGLACTYKGTAAANTLALDAATCEGPKLIIRCTNGSVRDMELVGSALQGTIAGGQVSGTMANSFNVYDAATGLGVTRVTLNYQFNAAKP